MAVTQESKIKQLQTRMPAPVEPPEPELSWFRIIFLLVVIVGIAFGVWKLVSHARAAVGAKSHAVPVYTPYVDATLTPTYQFQIPSDNPVSTVYLGFIVSKQSSPCTPSWGNYYTLAQADQTLDLGARIAQLRKEGGSAMISFGGQANTDLAVGCTNLTSLEQAYLTPIQRYKTRTIDLDVEGAALAPAADARRAQAIAADQKTLAKQHKQLHVWMTLPVSSTGLTSQGVAAVQSMLKEHVTLAGVNAMAMDFGAGVGANGHMFDVVRKSLYATHAQVQALWRQYGLNSTSGSAWAHLGVTVMIGVNNNTAEHFTISDARKLTKFVNQEGIPRVSVWSLNRDSECGGTFVETGALSNTCSGVRESSLEFTKIFAGLRGTKTATAQTTPAVTPTPDTNNTKSDNPATSPYPIWQSDSAYVTGYKVVWQGDIYEANWWSQGTAPGSTDSSSTTSGPWLLIGPVPSDSHAPQRIMEVSTAKLPSWSATTVYQEGQTVMFDGLPFQARFYTKGDQPESGLPGNPESPWEPMYRDPGEPTDTGIGSGESS